MKYSVQRTPFISETEFLLSLNTFFHLGLQMSLRTTSSIHPCIFHQNTNHNLRKENAPHHPGPRPQKQSDPSRDYDDLLQDILRGVALPFLQQKINPRTKQGERKEDSVNCEFSRIMSEMGADEVYVARESFPRHLPEGRQISSWRSE